jgi:uncharacterized membrane protein YidH (DUF202 family)
MYSCVNRADCLVSLFGLVLTLVFVNLLGALAFHDHPSHQSAQGLGSIFTYISLMTAPLGALYWGDVVKRMRKAKSTRQAVIFGAIGTAIFILLMVIGVLGVGWNYAISYGR